MGPFGFYTQLLTQPFHIVKMKRSKKNMNMKNVEFDTVAAKPNPPPYPFFVLSFDDKLSDPSSVADALMKQETIKLVDVLSGVKMFIVRFHEDMIDPCLAKELLLDLLLNIE